MLTQDRLVVVQQVVQRVREVLLVELSRLRRLSLVAELRAEVRAVAMRPRAVPAAVGQLRVVRPEVHAIRESVRDLVLGVCGAERAVHVLLANDGLRLEQRIQVERIVIRSRIVETRRIRVHVVDRLPERSHGEEVSVRRTTLALIRENSRKAVSYTHLTLPTSDLV